MDIIKALAEEFKLREEQVQKTVELIDNGDTIPFIARYRKEVTGSLDDAVLRDLNDRLEYLRNIEKRKEEVRALIDAQGKLNDDIIKAIADAKTITEVDDIYRPYRPKRKTRASVARERGLEGLSEIILRQERSYVPTLDEQAMGFVDPEKDVHTLEDAYAGARDIIAEMISDNAEYRKSLRSITFDHGVIKVEKTKEEDSVYAQYYDYSEPLKKIPPHRILAVNRGEKEEYLKISVVISSDIVLNYLFACVISEPASPAYSHIAAAVTDGYERLIAPSIEREIRNDMFDSASEGAIKVFADNLSHLLMQAPIKGKTVLGFDPGYVNGCKLAVVDKTGKVLDTAVIYPTKPRQRTEESARVIRNLVKKHGVDIIAIGNGTASRESEQFVSDTLKSIPECDCKYIIVSEAGASVYSASKLATEEFPEFDVMQRSAVSIARRLQDPLAELVKIDPKSIGVGQYQHDMKQNRLDTALGGVVEDCVNSVGVDINTASYSLLSYISGINITSAKNIVKYREENGEFTSRSQIKKVPRIGDKAYTQCAGFLRVPGGKEILDNTGVHPESYGAAKELLSMFGYTLDDVRISNLSDLRRKAEKEGLEKVAEKLNIGKPTLIDIIGELEKPGRDVRDTLPLPVLREDVLELEDLKPDMILQGTVRNVIDFGAFVDIGVHQDGLVHISQISNKYIKHPSEVLSVGDIVKVKVLSVDAKKKRIALSMKL